MPVSQRTTRSARLVHVELDDSQDRRMASFACAVPPADPVVAGLEREYKRLVSDATDRHLHAEALRGALASLRLGKSVDEAVRDGVGDCKYAAQLIGADAAWAESYLRHIISFLKGG